MNTVDVRPVRWRSRLAMVGWLIVLAALSMLVLLTDLHPSRKGLVFAVGAIGAWRYSWALLNITRAVIYRRLRFPGLRVKADRALATAEREGRMPHLFVLVTS